MRVRSFAFFAGMFVFAMAALSGCADGDLFNPNRSGPVQLALRPYFAFNAASSLAEINQVRVTIHQLPGGEVVGQEVVDVDPASTAWNLTLAVPANSDLRILIELLNVTAGITTVQYSGIVEMSVTSGPQPAPAEIPVFPGGPENLGITNLTITPRDRTLLEGETVRLQANVTGGPANPVIHWISLNSAVATVSADGTVTAVAPGSAVITAQAGPRLDNITIGVDARATRIEVSPASPVATSFGADVTFSGRVLDARGNEVPGLGIEWSITDGAIATQVSPGVFRARRNGTTTVTGTATQGGQSVTGTATLKVEQRPLSITLTPDRATFRSFGETATLRAAARDENNNEVTGLSFTWTSSDAAVATVDAGVVTARGNGVATIRAELGGVFAEAQVTVAQTAASLLITPREATLHSIAETVQLNAEVRDARGNLITSPIVWSSTLPGIATVDDAGIVTATGDGVVVITAQGAGAQGSATIQVDRTAAGVLISPSEFEVSAGSSFPLRGLATDANGYVIHGVPVTWSSTDPDIATVNATGVVTGVSPGRADISASAGGSSATSIATVTAPIGNGRLTGRVVDIDGGGITGADVTFTQGSVTHSVTSGSGGSFLSPELPGGSWNITASMQGFVSSTYEGAVIQPNQTTTIESLILVPFSEFPGSISGTIRNARTLGALANATVELREGQNVTTGPVVRTTTANSSGYYEFNNLAARTYTLVARTTGFTEGYRTGVVVGNTARTSQDIILTPFGNPSEIYIVLTWGANPRDLDSHLTGPDGGGQGGRFHVYYGNSGSLTSFPFAQLDVDYTGGFGPETITVSQTFPGVYRYYVHHYSGSQTIATSGAMVRVYRGSSLIGQFNAPNQPGGIWNVFEYDGTTITPIQTIGSGPMTNQLPGSATRRSPFDVGDASRVLLDVAETPKRGL